MPTASNRAAPRAVIIDADGRFAKAGIGFAAGRGSTLCLAAVLLCGAWLPAVGSAGALDGQWRLNIQGHNTYLYGEPQLGGGLRIPWEVDIRFRIADGSFDFGSGAAHIAGPAKAFSHPPGWVNCREVAGSYLDSSLALHETPRVRYSRFPVAGEVVGADVVLQPGYGPPGNYLAVTYECVLHDDRGNHWFALAERDKQVMGKRQDAEPQIDGDRLQARVREVVVVPPEDALTLPLSDGWQFSRGTPDSARWLKYRLSREQP